MVVARSGPHSSVGPRPSRAGDRGSWARTGFLALAALAGLSCSQTLDAGGNEPGPLPVNEHNPVILLNDSWSDNWSPEYAALLANHGGPPLAAIVVNATRQWPDLDVNLSGWGAFVQAARASGLEGLPDPVRSEAPQLVVPPDRQIASTTPNDSAGARLIVRKSKELSLPGQPVVVVSGSQLTDIADAYLLDPTVAERVVVVAQLGSYAEPKAAMAEPNGDLDPWADWIVAQHFTYVQLSVHYDQGADLTVDDFASLPANPLGEWLSAKHGKLSELESASEQEAILAVADERFVAAVVAGRPDTSSGFNVPPGQGPSIVPSDGGNVWLVTRIDPTVPRSRLWSMLTQAW